MLRFNILNIFIFHRFFFLSNQYVYIGFYITFNVVKLMFVAFFLISCVLA